MNSKSVEYKKQEVPLDTQDLINQLVALACSQVKARQYGDASVTFEEALNL